MNKKGVARKRILKENRDVVEDLDLDVGDYDGEYADEDVVHNRRSVKTKTGVMAETVGVLPSDAHRLDGYGDDEFGGFGEEEELVEATSKSMRKRVREGDFDVAGISLASVKVKGRDKSLGRRSEVEVAPVLEAVERDFASLSTTERLAILKMESPELLKMLDDLKKYLAEVKGLAKPLHELLYERKVSDADRNLVSFLETKVQLMLSYCMHVTFYLLLKTEGKKIAGHPVIDNLIEIRVYLEKMWPLEEKLQYSLNRLLSGKTGAAAHLEDLRPLQSNESGTYEVTRSMQNTAAKERRRQLRSMREAEELEKEEESAMTRVRTKKASALNALNVDSTIAPLSYQEDEDQYFARIAGSRDDEEGLSLMDRLRRRQNVLGHQPSENDDDEELSTGDDDEGEVDIISDHDGDDVADYDALFEMEQERERVRKEQAASPRKSLKEPEVDRRKVGKKIESHRGLTKARPKDRKNPRVAQRRKYERGLRVHKAQTRTHQSEPEGGFMGVRSIKPGVVRSQALR